MQRSDLITLIDLSSEKWEVRRSERLGARGSNDLGAAGAKHHVSREQTSKEEDFGGEEEPHPELSGVDLLLHRLEVVGKMRIVPVTVVVVTMIVGLIGRIGLDGRHPIGSVSGSAACDRD